MPRRSTPQDFWNNVDRSNPSGCWPYKLGLTEHGYGHVRYQGKNWKASRLAWTLIYGHPGDLHVLHVCDNPRCCNPVHLFLGTALTNARDKAQKGRHPRNASGYLPHGDQHHSRLQPELMACGVGNGAAVLTDSQVTVIRAKCKEGATLRALAKEFGVAKGTISFIVHRKTWTHLP